MPKEETQAQKDARAKKCAEEIEKICKKYNCTLDPLMTVTKSGVTAGLNINAI